LLPGCNFKLSGRQVETGKKSIFLVKKSKKCQKTAILDQKTIKIYISNLATRKFEAMLSTAAAAVAARRPLNTIIL